MSGRLFAETGVQFTDGLVGPFSHNPDTAVGEVLRGTAEPEAYGLTPCPPAEADTLDVTVDKHHKAAHTRSSRERRVTGSEPSQNSTFFSSGSMSRWKTGSMPRLRCPP